MLFDEHMPDFACRARHPVINLAVDYQATTNATSQADIEYDALDTMRAMSPSAIEHFRQGNGISIVVYYTRYIKSFRQVVL